MDLSDFAEKPLAFDIDEKLSKVMSKMYTERKFEVFVFGGKKFVGILSARDIVNKGFEYPDKVKLSSMENTIRKSKVLGQEAELKTIVNSFLINNYRCVPVEIDGEMLNISKLGLIKAVDTSLLKGKKASDIMFYPQCVSNSDPMSVVKSVFRASNAYRLAVMKGSTVEGIVDEIDLLKWVADKTKSSRGKKVGERVIDAEIPISSHLLMQDNYISVAPGTELKYVVRLMTEKNQDTVVVEEDGKLIGMITPREILKLEGSEIGGVYVNITGIHDEDDFIKDVVDSDIRSSIRKLAKVIHIHYVTLNVKRKIGGKSSNYKVKTKKTNYTVIGRIVSNKGSFFADDNGWDLTRCTQNTLKKLEKEVHKRVGKERVFDRGPEGVYR